MVQRDAEDNIIYYWNNRLRKHFSKPVNPEKFYMTQRRHYYTGGVRQIKVWACVCGNLTEEKE